MREKKDCLVVGHVYNSKKEYLPFNMKPQYLQDMYQAKTIMLGHYAHYVDTEVNPDLGVKITLQMLAKDNNTTIMVTGYNGVKGPKADPTIMGTNISYLSENTETPVLVIKDARRRENIPGKLYHYGVCYDGSDASKATLETALAMMKPEDRLTTITVHEPGLDDDKIESMVNEMRKKAGHSGPYKHVALDHEMTVTIYNTIKNYLKSQVPSTPDYIDWICLGNTGRGYEAHQNKLGSLANACLRAKRMNVLFIPKK